MDMFQFPDNYDLAKIRQSITACDLQRAPRGRFLWEKTMFTVRIAENEQQISAAAMMKALDAKRIVVDDMTALLNAHNFNIQPSQVLSRRNSYRAEQASQKRRAGHTAEATEAAVNVAPLLTETFAAFTARREHITGEPPLTGTLLDRELLSTRMKVALAEEFKLTAKELAELPSFDYAKQILTDVVDTAAEMFYGAAEDSKGKQPGEVDRQRVFPLMFLFAEARKTYTDLTGTAFSAAKGKPETVAVQTYRKLLTNLITCDRDGTGSDFTQSFASRVHYNDSEQLISPGRILQLFRGMDAKL